MTAQERTALTAGWHFIVPVWGAEYTRCFVELCLPTFLAPGNIPSLPLRERHAFQIHTTPEDRAVIEASPAYRLLTRYMPVSFHRVRVPDPTKNANRFSVQSDCYRRAIRAADAADRAMIFMTPDMIAADGSLSNLAALADRPGVRAVLGTGVRLVKETVGAHLLEHHRSAADASIAIGSRALVRTMLQNLHPIAQSHFFRGEGERIILANLYWRVGNEGLLARCFYLHPFLVYPRVKNAEFSNTVDSDYVEAACPDLAETRIITDSDEFCVCELSPASRTQKGALRSDPTEIAKWMRQWTTPRHRTLINTALRLHTGVVDPSLWQRAERDAQSDVAGLLSLLHAGGAASSDTGQAGYVEAAKASVPLCFVTALRSEAEARDFVDIALPSVLAPANIAAQVEKRYYTYRIAATASARAILEAAPCFAELGEHVRVEVETCDAAAMQKDDFAAAFRREAIAAGAARAAAMFIDPDTVLADNSLQILRSILRMNIRAVMVPRLRLRRATAASALREHYWIDGILSINPPDLVRLALDHLHPLARAQFHDTARQIDPATLCWRIGTEGVLMHAFDYYPLVIYPHAGAPSAAPVDHPVLGPLGFGANEISIIRDSKVLVQCQLSDDDTAAPLVPRRDPAAIAAWAAANTGSFSRLVFRNEIRMLAVETPSPQWNAVSANASGAVLEILAALALLEPKARRT